MPQSFDVITIGSATVDVFAHTDPLHEHLKHTHHHIDVCYPLGAKILVKELEFFTGGGGTNTGVGFARLGFETGYLGKLGKDENSSQIFKCLKDEQVTFLGAISKNKLTGYSIIIDAVAEDRTIFTFKGANDTLTVKDVDFTKLFARWFYLCSMMNESFETQKRIITYAVQHKIKFAFNPSLYLTQKGAKHLAHILKHAEILIFNKDEAQALISDNDSDPQNLCMKIARLGPKIVVITDGKNGSNCYNTHEHMFYSTKPARVKIVETTGAGDAFGVGFVAGIMKEKSTEIALKMGMLNAESVISAKGAKNILLGKKLFAMAEKDRRPVVKKKI